MGLRYIAVRRRLELQFALCIHESILCLCFELKSWRRKDDTRKCQFCF
jgi:hypothetical protein